MRRAGRPMCLRALLALAVVAAWMALSTASVAGARECTANERRVGVCTGLEGPGGFAGGFVSGDGFPTSWQARALLIRIACPANTQSTTRPGDFSFCTGTLVVSYRGRPIATVPFSIRTFDSHVEKVRVRGGARRLFQPGRHLRLHWRARSHDGRGRWATRAGAITVFNPYDRL